MTPTAITYIAISIGIGGTILFLLRRYIIRKIKETKEELEKAKTELKSAYVRFGKSFEHFVPFIKDFPGDRNKTIFLGIPVDFISFDGDMVRFIEVKTGSSQLNHNQKRIKKLIDEGKVEFLEMRYNEEIPKIIGQ